MQIRAATYRKSWGIFSLINCLCKRPQLEPQNGALEDPLLRLAGTANLTSFAEGISPKGMFQQFSWGTSPRYDVCRVQVCRNVMPSHVIRHLLNFVILFDTKTLNSLGGCRIHANTIDESDQQWKVQSKSMASLVFTISSANKSAAESSNLGNVKAFNGLTWHRADGLSILHWSPNASIDTLHKLTC